MARMLKYLVLGLVGAVIAWAILEPTPLMDDDNKSISLVMIFVIGIVSGLFVGLAIGFAEATSGLSPRDSIKAIISGALIGAAGGALGFAFGNTFFNIILNIAGGTEIYESMRQNVPPQVSGQMQSGSPGLLTFLLLLFARGSGWALVGAFIGLSQGIAIGSLKKMINGSVGGFIGGGIGGSLFEILAWLNLSGTIAFLPGMVRFIAFSVTGATIGFFIGAIEEFTKQAWLVRILGRNEGKEYSIYKEETVIGRSEYADIVIFNDPDIEERHAIIRAVGRVYQIEDLGSFYGTFVNGQRLTTKQTLKDGDKIQIGKTDFQFRDKATERVIDRQNVGAQEIPSSQFVCQFCGTMKDANGICACSVGQRITQPGQTQNLQQTTIAQSSYDPFQIRQIPHQQTQPINMQSDSNSAKLTAISGPYSGSIYVLIPGGTSIGREASNVISLSDDNTVSRKHAMITFENGAYILKDLGSTNGTYVNGAKVTEHKLIPGDIVRIGSTMFNYSK